MKFMVLGFGKMGYAVAYDLIRSPNVDKVVVADNNTNNLKAATTSLKDKMVTPVAIDINNQVELVELMSHVDIIINCLPYNFNFEVSKAALLAKKSLCDLGGNEQIVNAQLELNEVAVELGVSIIPDLGLAPGLVSLLALSTANNLDELYEIKILVGGIPIEPQEPLNYCKLFSLSGLINEYYEDCALIRDGKVFKVPSLTGIEKIEFPKPFGTMEAFYTAGNVNSLIKILEGKIKHLNYKTIRYPGHCEQMQLLKQLNLMSKAPIKVGKVKIIPRDVLLTFLENALPDNQADAILLKISVVGIKEGKPLEIIWDCIDYADEANQISAMMRMTAYPTSIIAQMIARGDITQCGVLKQEEVIPIKLLLAELEARGITITRTERAPVIA